MTTPGQTPSPSAAKSAFSLVELLVVMAIIGLMMSLLIPATAGLLGTAGRKGAANSLLGTFEQARAAALESGSPVYLVFWRREAPLRDAFIVVRDGTATDTLPSGQIPDLIPLTGWKTLPQGIIFYNPAGSGAGHLSVLSRGLPASLIDKVTSIPQNPPTNRLAAIKFNESGIIEHPVQSPMALFIGEGTRDHDGREFLTGPRETGSGGGIEKFSFSKFTGRASLEISVGD